MHKWIQSWWAGGFVHHAVTICTPMQIRRHGEDVCSRCATVVFGHNSHEEFLFLNYNHLLVTWDKPWLSPAHLLKYATAVHEKGAALMNCLGFVDGSVRPICRPSANQQVMYNGHKRVHALKYQSVTAANGMIASWFGSIEGRRHDSYLLRESGLLDELDHMIRRATLCAFMEMQLIQHSQHSAKNFQPIGGWVFKLTRAPPLGLLSVPSYCTYSTEPCW